MLNTCERLLRCPTAGTAAGLSHGSHHGTAGKERDQ